MAAIAGPCIDSGSRMLFTGTYEHTIDGKNRLAIPAQVRAALDPDRDGRRLYLVPGRPWNTLWLYTEKHFHRLAEQIGTDLIPNDEILQFEQQFFPNAVLLEPDPQGRVLLPDKMVRRAGLGRDVVICGVRDHLEIRRRDEHDRRVEHEWHVFPELQLRARRSLEQQRRQSGEVPE